jgi:hypothetical protein
MDTNKENGDNLTTSIEPEKKDSSRPWIKPDFQKEPLKEALSGLGVQINDGPASSS